MWFFFLFEFFENILKLGLLGFVFYFKDYKMNDLNKGLQLRKGGVWIGNKIWL